VLHATFEEDVESLQVALFYGAKYKTVERCRGGSPHENFEFVKVYQVQCRGKNVMLKYKKGELELQRGTGESIFASKKRSLGGGIDMSTNVSALEPVRLAE